MEIAKFRTEKRSAKHASIRKTCLGTKERPRLCVRRTLKHVIAQVIDDQSGISLLQVSSQGLDTKGNKTALAKQLGKVVGEKLLSTGIDKVVFDRGGYVYHGRVKSVADGARESGLKF
jgi:large subunit ribosomal protein L18